MSRATPRLGEAPLTSRTLHSCFQAPLPGRGTFGSSQRPRAGLPTLRELVSPLCEAAWPLSIAGTSLRSRLLSSFSLWHHCIVPAPVVASVSLLLQLRRSATSLQRSSSTVPATTLPPAYTASPDLPLASPTIVEGSPRLQQLCNSPPTRSQFA